MEGNDTAPIQAISQKNEVQNPPPPPPPPPPPVQTNGTNEVQVVFHENNKESPRPPPPPPPQAENDETKIDGRVVLVKEETKQEMTITEDKNQQITKSNVAKKRGLLHAIRVALFMLHRRSGKSSKSVQAGVGSKGLWRRIVSSMRSLHLHDNHNQQPQAVPDQIQSLTPAPEQNFQEMNCSHITPDGTYISPLSSPFSSGESSADGGSCYASAHDLQELGRKAGSNCDDDEMIEQEILEYEDEMIDAKAEAFIANFYLQLQLQRLQSWRDRSLG